MRDFGSTQSPQSAFLLNLGLESLHVRMQRHCANGMAVAKFLEAHPKVAYVNYCGPPSPAPYHALAEKYLPNGSCGVVSFGLAGGREAASTFMKELKLAAIETHVADDAISCVAFGTGKSLDSLDQMQDGTMNLSRRRQMNY